MAGNLASGSAEHVPSTMLLQWHVTSRCNLRCSHCYQEDSSAEELGFDGLLLILTQYEELLARWRSSVPGHRIHGNVTITGGEPFARPDIWQFLEILAARREQYSFAVLTNGTLVDSQAAQRLRELRPAFVQVSLDGNRSTHDQLRGMGNFDRVVKAIRHLREAGLRTLISFTASRLNYREFGEVAALGASLGVTRVWADRLIPMGQGAELASQQLSPSEAWELLQLMRTAREAIRRRGRYRTEIALHRALQFLVGGGAPYYCRAADTLLAVQPNGDLLPCRRLPIKVGNLFQDSLSDLYEHSPLLRSLRERGEPAQGCAGCPHTKTCAGGLRCLAYAVHGNPFVADPGCWLARDRADQTDGETGCAPTLAQNPRVALVGGQGGVVPEARLGLYRTS